MKYLMGAALLAASLTSQFQGQRGQGRPPRAEEEQAPSFVEQMMKYDKDKDGKLTKAELGDSRLARLFSRADADQDGVVTKQELTALESQEGQGGRGPGPGAGRRGGPPRGGFGGPDGPPPGEFGGPDGPPPRGGFGGPDGPPPGDFGGPGGPPPRREGALTGEIIPPQVRDALELTEKQEKDLDTLQKDVDAKLAKILTAAQKKQLQSMQRRGPGGGRPPGFGGFRGPGGPPPGEGPDGPPPRGGQGGRGRGFGGPPPGEGPDGPPPRDRGVGGPPPGAPD